MDNTLQVGNTVEVLDENLRGVITKIQDDTAFVEIQGFEQPFDIKNLVKIQGEISFSYREYDNLVGDKDLIKGYKTPHRRIKEARMHTKEIDLHIEKLLPPQKYNQMFPLEILEYQKETTRREVEAAIAAGVQKLVIIHGVGDGILKDEVEHILYRYNRIRISNGDFTQYGDGATTAYISASPLR